MRICFIVEHPSTALAGAEVAMANLACELSHRGLEIHYVSCKRPVRGAVPEVEFHSAISSNVRFFSWLVRQKGRVMPKGAGSLPDRLSNEADAISRFLPSKVGMAILDGIWTRSYGDALSDADCDIYIQVCAGRATGYVGDFCRREEKPFIFRATSIWDADVTFTSGQRTWRRYSKLCYLRGLRATNIIACNSLNTMRAFGKHFEGQRLRLLRDGFDVSQTVGSHSGEGFILWVGRDAWYKHPQLFLSLAEMLPKYRFVMVGNIRSLRNCPPNLELVGQKPPGEIGKLYSEASIVVNTSEVEGFPNVLVEAGQWRLPYVAFFDPDDVITHEELGINPKSVEEMAESIKKLMGDEKERERLGANGRRFVEREFGIERAADKWIQVFRELTGD